MAGRGPNVAHWNQTSLELDVGASFAQWQRAFEHAFKNEKASNWWLGDALIIGEERFGEDFAQVVDPKYTEHHKEKIWVCRKVPPERRREALSWSIHREVAALEVDDQEEWLGVAEANDWTVKELKEALTAWKARRHNNPPKEDLNQDKFPLEGGSDDRRVPKYDSASGYTEGEFADVRKLIEDVRSFGGAINGGEIKEGSQTWATLCEIEDRVLALLPRARVSSDAQPLLYIEDAIRLKYQGWLMNIDEDSANGWRTTLRRQDKACYGINKHLPSAIVEAVLTAAINDRQ